MHPNRSVHVPAQAQKRGPAASGQSDERKNVQGTNLWYQKSSKLELHMPHNPIPQKPFSTRLAKADPGLAYLC